MGHTSTRRVTWLRQEARRPDCWPKVHGAPTEQTGIERRGKFRLAKSCRYICTLGIKIWYSKYYCIYQFSFIADPAQSIYLTRHWHPIDMTRKTCLLRNHHDKFSQVIIIFVKDPFNEKVKDTFQKRIKGKPAQKSFSWPSEDEVSDFLLSPFCTLPTYSLKTIKFWQSGR